MKMIDENCLVFNADNNIFYIIHGVIIISQSWLSTIDVRPSEEPDQKNARMTAGFG